jgi:1,4-dihydroxy-2-naphthoyl-CoA hydrolase
MDKQEVLHQINEYVKNTLIDYLGIEFVDVGPDYLEARMPVNEHTHNPAKILHGGALMALAESVGSALSFLFIDKEVYDVRGVEINGNHLKSTTSGWVVARATLIHKGHSTHVCEIKIKDEHDRLINISRMTNMIVIK